MPIKFYPTQRSGNASDQAIRFLSLIILVLAGDCLAAPLELSIFPSAPRSNEECAKLNDKNGSAIFRWWSQSTREADHNIKLGSNAWSREYARIGTEGNRRYRILSQEAKSCFDLVKNAAIQKKIESAVDIGSIKAASGDVGRNPSTYVQKQPGELSLKQASSANRADSERRISWLDREAARKYREAEFNRQSEAILASETDEGKRHIAINHIFAELSRIGDERKADARPTSINLATNDSSSNKTEDRALTVAKEAVKKAVEAGEKTIDADIRTASRYMSGEKLSVYAKQAADTKAVLRGLGNMVSLSDYAVLAAQAAKADSRFTRDEAVGKITMQFLSDLSKKGASSDAVKSVLPRLVGSKAAAVLMGPAAWVGSVGIDVINPEQIALDDSEIIRDELGKFSLSQQQEALSRLWRGYEKFGYAWGDGQKVELLTISNLIYSKSNNRN